MRKQIILFSLVGLFFSCAQQNSTDVTTDLMVNPATGNQSGDTSMLPRIKFTEEKYDFGRIVQGEMVNHSFEFTNTGKSNLIITSARASCGCTVAEPPKEPVPPGAVAKISVTFDSNGKEGSITKSISVVSNCIPSTCIISIHGEVIAPQKN